MKPTYEQLEQRIKELELAESENKRTEEALRDSNDKLTALIQSSPMAIIILDPAGNVRLWNPAAEKMFGWKADEVIGSFHPIVPEEKKREHDSLRKKVMRGESFSNVELRRQKKDGSEIYISVSTVPLKNPDGSINAIMSVNVDITERKRAEEKILQQRLALMESKAKLEGIFEYSATGITLSDLDGKILQTNPAHQKIFGYSSKQMTNMLFSDFTHPDDVGKHQSSYKRLLAGEIDYFSMEKRFIHKMGHLIWTRVLVSLIRDNNNQPLYVVGMVEDITDRKETEKKLKESEKRFKDLTDMLPEAIFEADAAVNLTYANRQAFSLFGYTPQDFEKGLNGIQLLAPGDREKARKRIAKQLQGKVLGSSEYNALKKDGTIFPILLHATPIIKEGALKGFRGIIVDMAERKQAEEALTQSEELFRIAFDTSPDSVTITDMDEKYVKVNAGFTDMTGYSRDEVIGKKISDIPIWNSLKNYQQIVSKLKKEGALKNIESRLLMKDGSHKTVLMSANIITLRGKPHILSVTRDITDKKMAEIELQKQMGRLKSLYSINQTITASLDLDVTLDVFLNQVIDQLKIDAADVLLLDKESRLLKHIASKGFRSDALKYTRLQVGESNAGRAAKERRIVTIPDLRENIDGFENSKFLSREDFVTYIAVPLIAKNSVMGVLEIFNRSFLTPQVDWLSFLKTVALEGAIALDNANLFTNLQQSNASLALAYDSTIEGWSRALDLRDKETKGHSQRVTELTLRIAGDFGIKGDDLIHMRRGALLHDIGKMGIPDSILLKPGRLDEREREIMELHPTYARDLLYPIEYLRPAIDIPYYHHERWDGSGYPEGLKGEAIPFAARIFALVDVWDALTSVRPYRPSWSEEKAVDYIRSNSGTYFDAEIVEKFLEVDLNNFH